MIKFHQSFSFLNSSIPFHTVLKVNRFANTRYNIWNTIDIIPKAWFYFFNLFCTLINHFFHEKEIEIGLFEILSSVSLHFARIKQQNKSNWRMFVIGYCKHHALRNTYYSEVAVTHVGDKCSLLKVLLLFVYSIFMSKQLNINNFCIAEVGRRKTTDFSFGFSLHIHLQIFILTISFSFFFLLLPPYTI